MKFLLKLLGTLIGFAILGVVGLAFFAYKPLPSDKALVEFYYQNTAPYAERTERIRQTMAEHKPIQNSRDETLGYFAVEARSEPFSVLYFTHSSGIGVGAYGVGIAYFDSPPQPIYASLSAMKEDAAKVEGFRGYGSIEGNWYYAMWEAD